ncbi:hypothetical protein Clacol_003308 [Clathrus columnatus]|uniref:Uncharacterized protein n=1 Tax=Clathrus columnatus TaxID=1419009 RepID=A0AAV5A7V1_9AGAM|nr:hypothetical protein Clacol_003308 [Clathrus columnatus]
MASESVIEEVITSTIDELPPIPKHTLIDLKKVPSELRIHTFTKIVGDESSKWYQCGFRGCDTAGALYQTLGDIVQHIEEEITRYPYACSWRVNSRNGYKYLLTSCTAIDVSKIVLIASDMYIVTMHRIGLCAQW